MTVETDAEWQVRRDKEQVERDELVRLRNGVKEHRPLVRTVSFVLKKLMDEGKGIVLFELVELCRKPGHKPWDEVIGADLKALSLATETDGKWHVHSSIRNIVLSSVEGEGMNMTLVSPVA